MKSRLFTFGCSFVKYEWPTWADILGTEYDVFENWGQIGAGNHYILYSITEAVARKQIGPEDTVAVMFTNVAREDHYSDNQWILLGNVFGNPANKEKPLSDPTGYLLSNLSIIDATRRVLDQVGCQYHLMSTVPFNVLEYSQPFTFRKSTESKLIELYKETLSLLKPSVFEVVYNCDWNSRSNSRVPYSKKDVFKGPATEILKARYLENVGDNWPSFDDFINNNLKDTPQEILTELEDQYQFVSWRDNILNQRRDFHPTPQEHFDYLEKVGFELSNKQREYAKLWDQRVLTLEKTGFKSRAVKRF